MTAYEVKIKKRGKWYTILTTENKQEAFSEMDKRNKYYLAKAEEKAKAKGKRLSPDAIRTAYGKTLINYS